MENEFIQKQYQPVPLQFICTLKIALYTDCTQSGIVLYLQDGEWVYSETVPACLSPVYLYTVNRRRNNNPLTILKKTCMLFYFNPNTAVYKCTLYAGENKAILM